MKKKNRFIPIVEYNIHVRSFFRKGLNVFDEYKRLQIFFSNYSLFCQDLFWIFRFHLSQKSPQLIFIKLKGQCYLFIYFLPRHCTTLRYFVFMVTKYAFKFSMKTSVQYFLIQKFICQGLYFRQINFKSFKMKKIISAQQQNLCLCIRFVCLSVCLRSNSRKYSSNVLELIYVIYI